MDESLKNKAFISKNKEKEKTNKHYLTILEL